MKLSEAFGLLGTSTLGDSASKYDRHLPRLNRDGSIALSDIDGSRIEAVHVREVAQWVSTIEDNDDLTHALLSAGKRKLRTYGKRLTMHVTDARVVFMEDKAKNPDERVVGHIRYPWIDAIVWRPRLGRFARQQVQIWMHQDFPVKHLGTWDHYIEIEFDDAVDGAPLALDLVRRVSAHNLVHGAPAWVHDRLREQAQTTALPEPDESGEVLWECPASVSCPHGAEYIGDLPGPATWICRGATAPEPEPDAETEPRTPSAPSTLILKNILARSRAVAREHGRDVVETGDLMLALLFDEETPVGQLMARHGADYDSLRRQLVRNKPVSGPVRGGKIKPRLAIATTLTQAASAAAKTEEDGDDEAALAAAQHLLTVAEKSEISTLTAMARCLLADAYRALDRLDDAERSYECAASLRSAPLVDLGPLAPKIDPLKVVDDALFGLSEVARLRNDSSTEVAALERLREFRLDYTPGESVPTAALELARAHGRAKDIASAARWGDIAQAEFEQAGQLAGAYDAATLVAYASNDAGDPERALRAAEDAIRHAAAVKKLRPAVEARYQRARANKALNNVAAAWGELLELLPDARRKDPSRARQIVIQLAEIEPVDAAAFAIDLANEDVAFYGPRSAEIALGSARALLPDSVDQARPLLLQSLRLAVAVLAHPDTVDDNVDRTFLTVGEALLASDDAQFSQAALPVLAEQLRRLDPSRLLRVECRGLVERLGTAQRFGLQTALARPIVDRLTEHLSRQDHPSTRDMFSLWRLQLMLQRGLKETDQRAEALAVRQDMIAWLRRAAQISVAERERLALGLANYGSDLMELERYADAHEPHAEAIDILRDLAAEGGKPKETLIVALCSHADLAARIDDRGTQRSRLQEALAIVDEVGDAAWAARRRTDILNRLEGC